MAYTPAVTSVTSTSGAYKAGAVIVIQVSFDYAVVVNGTPQLELATSPSVFADFTALTNGDMTLNFAYTVQAGDTSALLEVASTNALILNGGTITSASELPDLTLPINSTTGSLSSSATVVIDTTLPTAPSAPDLTSASDAGASNSDNVTNVITPTLTGTSEANAEITLYDTDGTTPLGHATANNSGTWSITTNVALTQGAHTLTAKAIDAAGNTSSASAGLTVAIDTTAPTVSSITRADANPTTADNLTYTVVFNESVTGLSTSAFDLTETGTANGSISSVSGSGSTYNVTVNSVTGDGTLRLDLLASQARDVAGNAAAGYTSGNPYTLDNTGPAVASVGVPADGAYAPGDSLDFTVNFNEAVTVDTTGGTPRVALTLDTSTVYAQYLSGSGNTALVFRYVVAAGDLDTNGVALAGSLSLNGGTLKDAVGNNANLSLNSVGALTGVLVESQGPSVTSISLNDSATSNATSVQYTVVFDEAVSGVDTSDFILTGSGVIGNIAGISGSGTTFTVAVDTVSGNGTLRLDVNPSNTGIQNLAGKPLLSGYTSGASYQIDQSGPSVSSVTPPADRSYLEGEVLAFTVNFNEAATVSGTPRLALTLDTGGTVYADYVSGSGTSALVFTYTVVAGNADANGIALAASLALNGATITDTAGNNATLTLNNVGSLAGVLIDAALVPPVFNSAVVTGNSLVISYTEATTLDSTHIPAASTYEVKVGGVTTTVTNVVVDAQAKTATLTLSTAATAGQAVTVAYTDPTTGDDSNALQNAAGTDAGSFLATTVTNNTVAPPVVVPPASGGITVTAPAGGGTLQGTAQGDTFNGSTFKDVIFTAGGADSVDAGAGIDTVVMAGARDQYSIALQADGSYVVRSLVDTGTVATLTNVERLSFDNQLLALDSTTTTGRMAELYNLALGRNPEESGLDFYIDANNQGITTEQLALSFVSSPEFVALHGSQDNSTFLTQLYQAAFNRAPDADGLAFYMQHLAQNPGAAGQASVIANFIDSSELAIKLAGLVNQGVPLLEV